MMALSMRAMNRLLILAIFAMAVLLIARESVSDVIDLGTGDRARVAIPLDGAGMMRPGSVRIRLVGADEEYDDCHDLTGQAPVTRPAGRFLVHAFTLPDRDELSTYRVRVYARRGCDGRNVLYPDRFEQSSDLPVGTLEKG